MAATISAAAAPRPDVSPWLATLTLMVGTLASVMGSSTINTALPDIMSGLAVNQSQVSWVSTSYMLANVIAIPSAAWLGNLLTRRNLFGIGVLVFLAGSVLCGVAWDFSSMIAFRVLQGLGAGLIMPTAQSVMFQVFPPDKRGMAMGIFGMGAIMGPAIGPTVGGYLVGLLGWRSIFFINVPFAVVSLMMLDTLPRGQRQAGLKFDALGFALLVVCLTTLQVAISNGAKDGWDANYIIACFVVCAVSGGFMLYHELTTPEPLLDLSVFRNGNYNAATLVSLVVGLGLFGSTFLVPVYMGNLLGYNALQIGLIMLPGSLLMGLMMLVAGRLSDLLDSRLLIVVGLGLFAYYLHLQSLADTRSSAEFYTHVLIWRGLGMGLVFSPLSTVALSRIPPQQIAQASGLFNLTRQLAGTIGIAALNTLLTTRSTYHYTILTQEMGRHAATAQRFVAGAQQGLIKSGLSPQEATMGASAMLGNLVRQQVSVLAFSDLFFLCMAATLLGLLPVGLIQPKQAR